MKKLIMFLSLGISVQANSQTNKADSLQQVLRSEKNDTGYIKALIALARAHLYSKPDTTLLLDMQGLLLSKKIGFLRGQALCLEGIADANDNLGSYPDALENYFNALKIYESINDPNGFRRCIGAIGTIYSEQGEYRQALEYAFKAVALAKKSDNKRAMSVQLLNAGDDYNHLKLFDSAKIYTHQCYELAKEARDTDLIGISFNNLGEIHMNMGQNAPALRYFRLSIPFLRASGDEDGQCFAYMSMAELFRKAGSRDSCLYYARLTLAISKNDGFTKHIYDASNFLAGFYKDNQKIDSAFVYLQMVIATKDSLFSAEKTRQIQNLSFQEKFRQQEMQQAQQELRNQIKLYSLLAALIIFLVIAFVLYRNNRYKQKTNVLLQRQKEKVESALSELKSTQAQLIQSEKMASLGELTAGIAHEIQNPLNFVNNFSEVNKELLVEMKDEIDKGNMNEVKAIADDVIENHAKINHHGRRADAIVKEMLQHSSTANGQKELTDINALAEEYLRLAYHGLRAKDKSLSANFKTDFDPSIGKINVVPQDIGKMILNLINNAFYAVTDKKNQTADGYEPMISVVTKKLNRKVEIRVADNGNGIPQKVLDKIFQPFFTTKPTGQGTGLGLSLAYDIVKAHGGEIKVNTREGEFTELVVHLPVSI